MDENIRLEQETAQPEVHTQPDQPEAKTVSGKKKLYREVRDIIVILTVFMLIYVLFFRAVLVVGSSMYDTLMDGDRLLLISNLVYRNPKRGDIIVASKDSFRNGECIIKRVIAVEGDIIEVDEDGVISVNGEPLEEDYVYSPTVMPKNMKFPYKVKAGCVFVMGDNRMNSNDSRSPEIGEIDQREILGKVIFLLLPGRDLTGDRTFRRIGVVH